MTNNIENANAYIVSEWQDRKEILLIDVRETSEFDQERIEGALLMPLSTFDPELFPVLRDTKVVLFCGIGKRSEAAGKMLLNEGYSQITHLEGGLKAWKEAGLPTEVPFIPPVPVTNVPQPFPALNDCEEYSLAIAAE